MGSMGYSFLWVMQDLNHPPYFYNGSIIWFLVWVF